MKKRITTVLMLLIVTALSLSAASVISQPAATVYLIRNTARSSSREPSAMASPSATGRSIR